MEKTMEAYIYDAVRTPRGKGKKDGALHGVTPLRLAETALRALASRNALDTALVDDVVLGCVEPVGEQGACIGRIAALSADYNESVAGVQINRFCASGLEACNMAAAQVMSGQSDLVVGGGVEAKSRVPMGASGWAWPVDPQIALKSYFVPQGYRPMPSPPCTAIAAPTSTPTRPKAIAARTMRGSRAGSTARWCRSPTTTA